MGLALYCLLVIIITLGLCWKWYDDEVVDEGPGASTEQVGAQNASASSHSEGANGGRKANIQQLK
jgi:hypothetical protein